MAQATDPATTPEIDVRWEMANYGRPTRYSNAEQIDLHPTMRHERIGAMLEEMEASMLAILRWGERKRKARAL